MNLFLLLIATVTATDLRSFLARRDYDGAVRFYRGRLATSPHDAAAMRDLARVYDHWRRFDSAAVWWARSLELDSVCDSAVVGRWQALYRRDEKDSVRLAATRQLIVGEARRYALGRTARELTLAYDGLALADSAAAATVKAELLRLFPDSPRGYELILSSFYDSLYPVWNNDTLKVPLVRRFLDRYPTSECRQLFYTTLLGSLFGLGDTAGLRQAAAEMIADDTLDPFRYRYAAALFNRLRFAPSLAEAYARRAITLWPNTRKPTNKPQEQWELEYPPLYGQARIALAEALMAQTRLEEAGSVLADALAQFRWDVNSEWTPAPFHTLLGEIAEQQGRKDEALAQYVAALSVGDSRNYWGARAETGFCRIRPATGQEQLEFGRSRLGYRGSVFTDVTELVGLAGRRESRVAWGDYDNDGYQDLLLSGSRLFWNDSGRRFVDVTDSVGLGRANGRGGLFADFNNDGLLDLYVAGAAGGARFYKNEHGIFADLSDRAGGPDNDYPTEGAGWADFDNDGWVDLYCANYENWQDRSYYPDKLYQNRRGYLADVTEQAGIVPPFGEHLAGRGVNWGDYDDDGWQDCYVSNYRLTQNLLWHNNRDSTFTNLAGQLGVAGEEVDGAYGHTIGSAWADFDNDGDLDLFAANLAHPRYIEFSNRSQLYQNRGPRAVPRFADCRVAAGIRYEETHSDPAWADVDKDGDLDLYITSIYEGRRSFLYENQLLPGLAKSAVPRFEDITWLSGTRVLNGWGCAFADFDNDGDQDLVVGSGSGVRLFRNDTRNSNHWLKVKVIGRQANRAGIGCRVTVTQGRHSQIREVEGGKGTTSQNSLIQHFGLGSSARTVTVEVRFGPGRVVVRRNVRPDQLVVVEEPASR